MSTMEEYLKLGLVSHRNFTFQSAKNGHFMVVNSDGYVTFSQSITGTKFKLERVDHKDEEVWRIRVDSPGNYYGHYLSHTYTQCVGVYPRRSSSVLWKFQFEESESKGITFMLVCSSGSSKGFYFKTNYNGCYLVRRVKPSPSTDISGSNDEQGSEKRNRRRKGERKKTENFHEFTRFNFIKSIPIQQLLFEKGEESSVKYNERLDFILNEMSELVPNSRIERITLQNKTLEFPHIFLLGIPSFPLTNEKQERLTSLSLDVEESMIISIMFGNFDTEGVEDTEWEDYITFFSTLGMEIEVDEIKRMFSLSSSTSIIRRLVDQHKKETNVILVSSDGHEFRSFLELLILKSHFFFLMLRFKGEEYESIKNQEKVKLIDIDGLTLLCILHYYYYFDKSDVLEDEEERYFLDNQVSFETIVKVLVHADKFGEYEMLKKCLVWINYKIQLIEDDTKKNKEKLEDLLFETGYLIKENENLRRILRRMFSVSIEDNVFESIVGLSWRNKKKEEKIGVGNKKT